MAAGADSLAARAAPYPVSVHAGHGSAGAARRSFTLASVTLPSATSGRLPVTGSSRGCQRASGACDPDEIRSGLNSGLDAAAARAVWPSVDHRALARAFDGLESQRFSLERCNVRLNGGSAQADCSGSAQWTPKVGGGAQTASRRWQFELKQNNGDWVIVRASVR